jgi:hypothetical protein
MTGSFTATLLAAALLSGAAIAQTQPQPGSENTQAPTAQHNNMLPAVHNPATSHKRRKHHNTAAQSSNAIHSSSNSSSSTSSSPTAPNAHPNPEATPSGPDQNKPGTQTRPQDNTTTMHTPGSENPADTGAGAPKN